MCICNKCGTIIQEQVLYSCPNCNAKFCGTCIEIIKEGNNRCPKCGKTPDEVIQRNIKTRRTVL